LAEEQRPAGQGRRGATRLAIAILVTALLVAVGARVVSWLNADGAQRSAPAPQITGPANRGEYAGHALRPDLAAATNRAIAAAKASGFTLTVTSGFRSWSTQQDLFDRAVNRYGSPDEARRWVLPPAYSEHVQGRAIDVGDTKAAAWLDRHGATWGLCRRYANESWHFELLTTPGGTCPAVEPFAGG